MTHADDDMAARVRLGMDAKLAELMASAERAAFNSLAKYDYAGFAASATRWTTLAVSHSGHPASPFRDLVRMAQARVEIHKRKGAKDND